jgi:hypothetical protein
MTQPHHRNRHPRYRKTYKIKLEQSTLSALTEPKRDV